MQVRFAASLCAEGSVCVSINPSFAGNPGWFFLLLDRCRGSLRRFREPQGTARRLMLSAIPRQPTCHRRLSTVLVGAARLAMLLGAVAQRAPRDAITAKRDQHRDGACVKDPLSRPITAGGFVDVATVVFVDITHSAGLDRFRTSPVPTRNPASSKRPAPDFKRHHYQLA